MSARGVLGSALLALVLSMFACGPGEETSSESADAQSEGAGEGGADAASAAGAATGAAGVDDARATDATSARPNLLVIVLDDWGVDRFDAYLGGEDPAANTSASTPVLDAFAAQSVFLRRAYSDPVCSPTRAAILTGAYGLRTGVGNGFPWFQTDASTYVLDPGRFETLPRALAAQGYRSAAIGKWHLTGKNHQPDPYMHPIEFGFERHRGLISNIVLGMELSYTSYEYNVADASGAQQTDVVDGSYVTTLQVDDALAAIDDFERDADPWFVWLALTAPHVPWSVPPAELVRSRDVLLDPPKDDLELYDAVLEAADTEIGRLLAELSPEVAARTVVVVLGDNGTPGGAFPSSIKYGKKGSIDEGGIHVPMMVRGPGITPRTSQQFVHAVDLYATLLELAGVTRTGELDSTSFAPLLRGEEGAGREWLYSARRRPVGFGPFDMDRRVIRSDGWKLTREAEQPPLLRRMDLPAASDEGFAVKRPFNEVQRAHYEKLLNLLEVLEQE